MALLPPISEALVKWLEEQTAFVPAPDMDDREIMYKAGQSSVARMLRQKMLDQELDFVNMELEGG